MESTLEMVNRKIKYFEAREKRFEGNLRTCSTPSLVLAEMRLEHTREIIAELTHIQRNLLSEKRENLAYPSLH